jgi:hypothetical protein
MKSLRKPHKKHLTFHDINMRVFKAEVSLPAGGAKPVRTYAMLIRGENPKETIKICTTFLSACEKRGQDEARSNEQREQWRLKTRKRKVVLKMVDCRLNRTGLMKTSRLHWWHTSMPRSSSFLNEWLDDGRIARSCSEMRPARIPLFLVLEYGATSSKENRSV